MDSVFAPEFTYVGNSCVWPAIPPVMNYKVPD